MTLSDQLLALSAQAKHLEASAEAVKERDLAKIGQRKAELQASVTAARADLHADLSAASEDVNAEWAADRAAIATSFDTLGQKRAARHTAWSAKRADRAADSAEADALDDIEFALYAIEEAEYSILDAVDARTTADDKDAQIS
jgi:hypothetical protein